MYNQVNKTNKQEEKEEDEFTAYFKQYRNFNGHDYLRGGSSRASSDEMSDVFSSSNSSSVGSFKHTLANLIPGRKNRKRPPPGRSRSEETGITMAQEQILRRQPYSVDSFTGTRYYLPDLDEDPSPPRNLPPLTLSKKIGVTNYTFNDKMKTYDEASRDSGHSSGGSPDLRVIGGGVVRRRRMINKQPEWFSKRQDSNSIYSYETAQDKTEDNYYSTNNTPITSDTILSDYQILKDPVWKSHLDSWSPPSTFKSSSIKTMENLNDICVKSSPQKCLKLCRLTFKVVFLIFSILSFFVLCFLSLKNMLCTSNRELKFDLDSLATVLDENLFGQHIARQKILNSLQNLVLSHHQVVVLLLLGWPGSGKTHTTTILKNHFPVPQNVHSFSVPLHFAPNTQNHNVLDDLSLLIPRSCGYSMAIFDDLDSTSMDYIDTIGSFIVSLKVNPGSKRRSNGTLIVISSNVGGNIINQYMLEQAKIGQQRSMITQDDILKNLSLNGINNDTLPLVSVLKSHGVHVDIIPYLPLTREHVRKCIKREMHLQGSIASYHDINSILDQTGFFSSDFPIFAKTGCKRIVGKVDIILGGRADPK